ncbi:hypothetical protein VNO77_44283 [Canavalia gladiata]|uniref:Uncharacterized protein n=1 Tax=Canavalia gladiata TaxID=3824 RepID=A0AAN9PNN4_CANGL
MLTCAGMNAKQRECTCIILHEEFKIGFFPFVDIHHRRVLPSLNLPLAVSKEDLRANVLARGNVFNSEYSGIYYGLLTHFPKTCCTMGQEFYKEGKRTVQKWKYKMYQKPGSDPNQPSYESELRTELDESVWATGLVLARITVFSRNHFRIHDHKGTLALTFILEHLYEV